MMQSSKRSWKHVDTLQNSWNDWHLIARLIVRLLFERRIERIRFADTGTVGVYKCDVRFRFKTEIHYAYGVGPSVREALLKSLAEAAERLVSYDANTEEQTSREAVSDTLSFDNKQYSRIRSVQAKTYADDVSIAIPAQCIRRYSKHLDGTSERLFPYTTSGIAAHTNIQSAMQHALFEVIERDAFLCYWYARHAPRVLNLSGAPERVHTLLQACAHLHIHVDILLLEHETGIPVIAAVGSYDYGGVTRRVLSLGCRESLDDAIMGALHELFIVKSHLYADADTSTPYETITAFGRARLWRGALCAELDYFLQGGGIDYLNAHSLYTGAHTHIPHDAVVYTYPMQRGFPLYVVKVIVPSYFPFFLHEPFKRFGGDRLRTFCAMRGIPYQMTSIPHVLP